MGEMTYKLQLINDTLIAMQNLFVLEEIYYHNIIDFANCNEIM